VINKGESMLSTLFLAGSAFHAVTGLLGFYLLLKALKKL
jgi:hypothetical protein